MTTRNATSVPVASAAGPTTAGAAPENRGQTPSTGPLPQFALAEALAKNFESQGAEERTSQVQPSGNDDQTRGGGNIWCYMSRSAQPVQLFLWLTGILGFLRWRCSPTASNEGSSTASIPLCGRFRIASLPIVSELELCLPLGLLTCPKPQQQDFFYL